MFTLPILLSTLAPLTQPVPGDVVELSYKTYRTWNIVLPAEQFARVSGGFSMQGCKGETFTAAMDGTALAIDTDGDGKPDVTVSGKKDESGKRTGLVTLEGTRADGETFTYTARLVDGGKGWHFAASGAMVGKIGETRIQLIDQNNNGRYDDFGEDAMIVGRGEHATLLSRAVNVGGELRAIQVSPDGSRLTHEPFKGPAGSLDLKGALETKGKLRAAIVSSAGGDYSFDLARVRAGMQVPVGEYSLHSGELVLGKAKAYVRSGRMQPMVVAANATSTLKWGGPLAGEFEYERQGGKVAFSPDRVTYFGKAGEEYRIWDPIGKSPEFTVIERSVGLELAKALFPGSS